MIRLEEIEKLLPGYPRISDSDVFPYKFTLNLTYTAEVVYTMIIWRQYNTFGWNPNGARVPRFNPWTGPLFCLTLVQLHSSI